MATGKTNICGFGLRINATEQNFRIASNQTISAGDLVGFINDEATKELGYTSEYLYGTTTERGDMIEIDAGKYLMVTKVNHNGPPEVSLVIKNVEKIIILNTITIDTGVSSDYLKDIKLLKLSSGKAVVVMVGDSGFNAQVLEVYSLAMTKGSEYSIFTVNFFRQSASGVCVSLERIDFSRFVVTGAYFDGTDTITFACIGTVTNDTISFGPKYDIQKKPEDGGLTRPKSLYLSSEKGIVYFNYDPSGTPAIQTFEITNGNQITFTSAHVLDSFVNNDSLSDLIKIDTTRCIFVYSSVSSQYPAARVLTISGTTVSYGAELILDTISIPSYGISIGGKLNTNMYFLSYFNFDLFGFGAKGAIVSLDGSTLSLRSNIYVASNQPENSNYLTKKDIDACIPIADDEMLLYSGGLLVYIKKNEYQGVAIQNGVAGETKRFYYWGG